MTSPDPVAEGAKYREYLISLVGNDDPYQIQRNGPEVWRALVVEAKDVLRVRPEPSEWSVLECLAHVVHAEIVMTARYRWALAHDAPELIGYDQDLWVNNLAANDEDPDDLLELQEVLRRANVRLWTKTNAEQRARVGIHLERGPESYEEMFTLYAGHDRFHYAQAQRALEALR